MPARLFRLIARPRLIALALVACGLSGASAQDQAERDHRGLPYHRVYGAKDFDSSATSAFITTATDGSIVYGDQNWIFLHDGVGWRKIYRNSGTPDKITCLRWDADGAIYAGGFNALGELTLDENNRYVFRSLTRAEAPLNLQSSFSAITATPATVYFLGRRCFAAYDKATGSIDAHAFDTWITASFFFKGAFHLVTDSNEILRYADGAFTVAEEPTAIAKSRDITIAATATLPNGDVIVGSERRGLYRFDDKSLEPAFPHFRHRSSHLLRDMTLTSDGRLALAFLEGGIIVLDEDGDTLETFSANVDHRFKSARQVMVDQAGTLWGMFNSSVAKIILDTPLTAIDEHLRPSLFYASPHLQGADLYLRSFYVLYQAEYDERGRLKGFRNALPDTDYEVWSVASGQDGLYFNTSEHGIFRLQSDAAPTPLIDAPPLDRLLELAADPRYLVGANSSRIILYRKEAGSLVIADQIEHDGGFINRIEEDSDGVLWLELGLGNVGRVRINEGRLSIDRYGAASGLPANEWITLWMHQGRALFTYADKSVALNEDGRFTPVTILDPVFAGDPLSIERAFTDLDGNIWLSANGANWILWRNDDGSYTRDDRSLSEMGEPYFEFLTHLPDGSTIIVTALECFHFRSDSVGRLNPQSIPPTRLVGITDLNSDAVRFAYLGDGAEPPPLQLSSDQNSIAFHVANAYSFSTKSSEFQFHLKGFSSGPLPSAAAPWTSSSSANFTNLYHGNYVFMARARLGGGQITPWTEYAFAVQPAFYQTYLAYGLYILIGSALAYLAIASYARRLRRQNLKLERMVAERTQEVEAKNLELERQAEMLESQNLELAHQSEEIQRNAEQLSHALNQLQDAQEQLLATARTAGRAEVATNVLHNVGNVLNSVNVSIANLTTLLRQSRLPQLARLSAMVNAHQADLQAFLAQDEKGRHIPEYLEKLSSVLSDELGAFVQEVQHMETNIEHIKKIIATQQTHAKNVGVLQTFNLSELIEAAVAITLGDTYLDTYSITRDMEGDLLITTDKHKLLDVLINLLKNAQESIAAHRPPEQRLHLSARRGPDERFALVTIADNGGGITPDSQAKLFTHGFTTRDDGHGFGLHSCANTIKALGGSISIESPGLGQGATARLSLPLAPLRSSAH